MKVRLGFVTNSSSSSYLILYKIKDKKAMRDYVLDQYGKKGLAAFDKANKKALDQAEAYFAEHEMFMSYGSDKYQDATDAEVHDLFMKRLAELGIDLAGEYAMYTEDWDYGSNSLIEFIMKAAAKENLTEKRFVHDEFRIHEDK